MFGIKNDADAIFLGRRVAKVTAAMLDFRVFSKVHIEQI